MRFFVVLAISIASLAQANVANAAFKATLTSANPGVSSPVYAAGLNWVQTQDGGVDVPWLSHNFTSFCIEYNQHVNFGSNYTYQLATLQSAPEPGAGMGTLKADQIRRLWAGYRSAIDVAPNPVSVTGSDGKYSINEKYAAFQVAIWKILGTTLPTFALDIETLATVYITHARSSDTRLANLVALTNDGKQDQIVEISGGWTPNGFGDVVQTPAPAALILAMSGLVPLFAFGRLRKMVI